MSNKEIFWVVFLLVGLLTLIILTSPYNQRYEEGLEGPSSPICYATKKADNGYFVFEADGRPILAEDLESIREQLRSGTGHVLGNITVWKYNSSTGEPMKIWIQVLGENTEKLPPQINLEID
jgi:hypothetical protein